MKAWSQLGVTPVPGAAGQLELYRDRNDFYIRTSSGAELMSTRKHGSEDVLGAEVCRRLHDRDAARVLIGGLGMGFTLAAALAELGPRAEVTVAELVPGVIEWNRGELGDSAGRPLEDPRTRVFEGDVAELLNDPRLSYDAIALDVDNGPEGLTQDANDWLYADEGLAAVRRSLRPGGCVGFWSAAPDPPFGRRLKRMGFKTEERRVYAHGNRGQRHTLWFGT